jgi:SAM-dependent methyltransferase
MQTADEYRTTLIASMLAEHPGAAAAHATILKSIGTIEDEMARWHAMQHEVRFLRSYLMVPPGPGLMMSVSDRIGPALTLLKGWSIDSAGERQVDFECDRLPYEDASLDGVLLLETIEHYNRDPLFSLIEINRVLKPGGFLLLSTPNAASWYGIHRALGHENPSRFAVYHVTGEPNCIHAREYTPAEIRAIVDAAGFEVETLLTEDYGTLPPFNPVPGFDNSMRGETVFCLARKAGEPKMRRIAPIYLADQPFTRA